MPVSFLISFTSVSFILPNLTLVCSALSTSTRTPLILISIKSGVSFCSNSNIFVSSCRDSSVSNLCHSFNVITASCSAYVPTYLDGSFHMSFLGSIPQSFAAARRIFSSLRMSMYSRPKLVNA